MSQWKTTSVIHNREFNQELSGSLSTSITPHDDHINISPAVGKEKPSGSHRRSESVNRHRDRSESVAGVTAARGGGGAPDQVKVSLLGRVRTFYKASKELPVQYLPPEKRLKLAWVYP